MPVNLVDEHRINLFPIKRELEGLVVLLELPQIDGVVPESVEGLLNRLLVGRVGYPLAYYEILRKLQNAPGKGVYLIQVICNPEGTLVRQRREIPLSAG